MIVIEVYTPNNNAEEAEAEDLQEDLLWRPTRLSRNNTKKDILFIIGDWNAKAGNQDIPRGPGKFGFGLLNEAGQRLTEYYQENALVIANTLFQQHKRWLYTWTSPDGQYRNQIEYILCSWRWSHYTVNENKTGSCDSDHGLLIVTFRLTLKKVGKTTVPFRYDLNPLYSGSDK